MPRNVDERPTKLETNELLNQIESSLKRKCYYFTSHAEQRSKQRKNVSELEVVKILRSESKYHEAKKDRFSEQFGAWNYSIRGKSIDAEDVRIIVSFDEKHMLIITVINLDN